MNDYIRDYTIQEIKTNVVTDVREFNKQYCAVGDNFKIIHINIRSISKNLDEFVVYLEQFPYKFDIIVLTETFKISSVEIFSLPGYKLVYNEGDVDRNDGVVVYIKENIHFHYAIVHLDNIKLLQILINVAGREIHLSALYRLHPTCPHTFNSNLHKYLQSIKNNVHYSVLIGDININILDHKNFTQDYLNILHEEGYISYINDYTRVHENRKSCIDHIFVKTNTVSNNGLIPVIIQSSITDHYPIVLVMDFKSNTNENKQEHKRYFIDYCNLKKCLSNNDWRGIYEQENVDDITYNFIEALNKYIRVNTRAEKIIKSEIPRKEWVTPGLLKSIHIKNELYKSTLKNPQDTELSRKYRDYKNNLTKLIKSTKMRYYVKLINKNINNTKHLYNTVKKICGSKVNKFGEITKIRLGDGSLTRNDETIAEAFNQHYINYGDELASKIVNVEYRDDIVPLGSSMFFCPILESETLGIINQLGNNKAPGLDKIMSNTVKEVKHEVVKPLTFLINKIMESGIWPISLKKGVVKPIFKSGDPLEISNYRPITLTSTISKIVEKAIKVRITNFLQKHNIISQRQFGFIEGRSTQDAIAWLTDNIYKGIDKNKPTVCIFVDLAKAFDTVHHSILLQKLDKYGFRGKALSLIKTYLENRTQCVMVNESLSTPAVIKRGVPQGTVLGPILFLLYINDLLTLESKGCITSYADDTAIIYSDDSWEGLKKVVETDFLKVKKWFDKNILTINYSKTTFLAFSSYSRVTIDTIEIREHHNNFKLTSSGSVKYLGIIIDKHLRWNLHINYIVRKLRGLLSKFKLLRNYLELNQMRMLYYSLVQSHITYGIIGWGGAYKSNLRNLEIMQKWFLKIILNKVRTYPTNLLYVEAHVYDIRQLFLCSVLYRQYLHNDHINLLTHSHDTRQREVLCRTTRCNKTIGQRSFSYIGQVIFNKLPETIKHSTSYHAYRKEIKDWLFTLPRQYAHDLIDS